MGVTETPGLLALSCESPWTAVASKAGQGFFFVFQCWSSCSCW